MVSVQEPASSIACQICFTCINPAITIDAGLKPISCAKCGVIVHKRCHGILSAENFTCDKCANLPESSECCLCKHSEGYLRLISPGCWVHPICALLDDGFEVTDFLTMSFKLVKDLAAHQSASQCEHCGLKAGKLLLCEHLDCTKTSHAYCAFQCKAAKGERAWQIELELKYNKRNVFSDRLKEYMKNQENYMQIDEELDKMPSEEVPQRNVSLTNRGGLILVNCRDHCNPLLHCICRGTKEETKDILICHHCKNLYHKECVNELADGICDDCRAWENAKKSYLLSEAQGKVLDLLESTDWKKTLFPSRTSILSDILLVSHLYSLRGESLTKCQCGVEMVYEYLLQGRMIPIQFNSLVMELTKKIDLVIELDATVLNILEEKSPLPIIDNDYNLIMANVEKNDEFEKSIKPVIKKYETEVLLYTSTLEKLKKTQAILKTLHEIGEKFHTCIEIDEATSYLKFLEENCHVFYMETQFFKNFISEFKMYEELLIPLNAQKVQDGFIFPDQGITGINDVIEFIKKLLTKKLSRENVDKLSQEGKFHFIKRKAVGETIAKEKSQFEERIKTYQHFLNLGCTLDQFKGLMKEICEGLISSEDTLSIPEEYKRFLQLHFVSSELLVNGVLLDEVSGGIVKAKCVVKDLEDVRKKCEQNNIKPLDALSALKLRISDIAQWQSQYKELVDKGESVEVLHNLMIKASDYKVYLPEFEDVETLNVIERFINSKDKVSYEAVLEIINKAKSNKIPIDVTSLQKLLADTESLIAESKRLISNAEYKEINQICSCITRMKESRVIFSNLETLEKIVEEFNWKNEIASLVNASPYEDIEYSLLNNLSREVLEEKYNKFEAASHNPIGPIEVLRKKIGGIIWLKKAKVELDPTNRLSGKELSELLTEMNRAGIDSSHPYCGAFAKLAQNLNEQYNRIMTEYDYLTKLDLDNVPEEDFEQLLQKTHNLKQDAFICQVNLSELTMKIHKMRQYINSYYVLLNLMKGKAKIDLPAFVKAFESLSSLQEGRGKLKLLERAKEQIQKYRAWSAKVSAYKINKEASLRDPNAQRITIDMVNKLIEGAKAIELPLGGDLELLKKDIEEAQQNEQLAKEFLDKLRSKDLNIKINDLEDFINKMKALPLYSEELFSCLKVYLIIYQSKDLVKQKSQENPKRRLDYWTTLIKAREEIASDKNIKEDFNKLNSEELIESLSKHYREGMMLMKQINDLKEGKSRDKFSTIDLELLLDFLKNSHIDFSEEVKYTEELMEKSKALEETFKSLIAAKEDFTQLKILKSQILKFPLNLSEVEREIDDVIKRGVALLQSFKELVVKEKKIRESKFITILEDYTKCPFKINEIEDAKNKYNKAKTFIEESKETLRNDSSIEKIDQITTGIAKFEVQMDLSMKSLSLELCRKRYICAIVKGKGEHKPTLKSLIELLEDFNKLKNQLKPLDLDKIKQLEQMISEVKFVAKNIKTITNATELNRYSHELSQQFIDYSDLILEQRSRIEPDFKITIKGKRPRTENVETGLVKQGLSLMKAGKELERLQVEKPVEIDFRAITRKAFQTIINGNIQFQKGSKKSDVLAYEIEEELMKQANAVNGLYRERVDQIKKNLLMLSNYPLSSEYLANGRLELWKLLKVRDELAFANKLKKIEGILKKKGKKVKKEEEVLPKSDLRADILSDNKKESIASAEGYDPLQAYPQGSLMLSKNESSKEENDSLEDVAIVVENKESIIEEKYSASSPYKTQVPIKGQYNPLETGVVQSKINKKTSLIPYDPNKMLAEQEEVAPGLAIRVWSGKINAGKLSFQAAMLTCDNIQDYWQVPALNKNLCIDGRTKIPSVIDYLEANTSHLVILKGWVLVKEDSAILSNYLSEMENTNKCAVIDIKEISSHLYLIPWNAKTSQFIQQWEIHSECENPLQQSMVKFAYFFAYKKRDIFQIYEPMRPVAVKLQRVQQPVESTFSGIVQADVLSEDEAQSSAVIPQEDMKETLRNKLSELPKEDIETLRSQLTGEKRLEFEKLLEELFPHTDNLAEPKLDYESEAVQPVPNQDELKEAESQSKYVAKPMEIQQPEILDLTEYMSKVWKVQGFIDKNRKFFTDYSKDLSAQEVGYDIK